MKESNLHTFLDTTKDFLKAKSTIDDCYLGWRDSIHDVYRAWMSGLWGIVYEELGEEVFNQTICATAPGLFAHIRGADPYAWGAFWSIHLRLRTIYDAGDRVEFHAGIESLLQPSTESIVPVGYLPYAPDQFIQLLNQGIMARGWKNVGTFKLSNGTIIHELPK